MKPRDIARLYDVDASSITYKVKRETGLTPKQYRSKCIAAEFEAGATKEELAEKYSIGIEPVEEHINKGRELL